MMAKEPPPIVGGSQDDLLEWSLRESGSGLASLTEGTMRGVDRLQRGEVVAAANSFHGAEVSANAAGDANISALRALPGLHDAVWSVSSGANRDWCCRPVIPRMCRVCLTCWYQAQQWRSGSWRGRAVPARCAAEARRHQPKGICAGSTRPVSPVPISPSRSAREAADCRYRNPGPWRRRRARFVPLNLGEFRSPDAAAQLFPARDPGAGRLPARHRG